MRPAINPVWWQAPQAMQPLDAVKITADHLEAGTVVPAAAANIVARAFRLYLAGQHDLTKNFGLRARRGGKYETPIAIESLTRRNGLIKALYEVQEGGEGERAQKVADLILNPPKDAGLNEAHVMGFLMSLLEEFGGGVPTSMRQIKRIVDGK